MTLEEIKNYELNILKFINHVCLENNIKYFLMFGTLLGAIRHNGFIPWDDDIDIVMTREEYIKFYEVMKNYKGRYRLYSLENELYWASALPKVIDTYTILNQNGHRERMNLGLYVDIFILDKAPNNSIIKWLWHLKIDYYNKLWSLTEYKIENYKNKNKLYLLLRKSASNLLLHFTDSHKLSKRIDNISQKYNKQKNTIYLSESVFPFRKWERMTYPKELFCEVEYYEFEGQKFPCPKNYDSFLKKVYGDYMKLPPIEKRVSNHDYEVRVIKNED